MDNAKLETTCFSGEGLKKSTKTGLQQFETSWKGGNAWMTSVFRQVFATGTWISTGPVSMFPANAECLPACLYQVRRRAEVSSSYPYFGHSRGTKVVRPHGPHPLHTGRLPSLFSPLSTPPFCCLFFNFYFIVVYSQVTTLRIVAGAQQSALSHTWHSHSPPNSPPIQAHWVWHITPSRAPNIHIFLQTRHTDGQEAYMKRRSYIANY